MFRASRFKNVETVGGAAVAIDETNELIMGEQKPIAQRFSIDMLKLTASVALLPTTLRRMFTDETSYGRVRPLQAFKAPVLITDMAEEVNVLLRAGLVGKRDGESWPVENTTLHALSQKAGDIGRAVALERSTVTLPSNHISCAAPGVYVVVRGEARPGGKAVLLLQPLQ